jgi:hypothetical protein
MQEKMVISQNTRKNVKLNGNFFSQNTRETEKDTLSFEELRMRKIFEFYRNVN